jgi:hypothetical protein
MTLSLALSSSLTGTTSVPVPAPRPSLYPCSLEVDHPPTTLTLAPRFRSCPIIFGIYHLHATLCPLFLSTSLDTTPCCTWLELGLIHNPFKFHSFT